MAAVSSPETFITACVSNMEMPFALAQLSRSIGAEGATLVYARGDTTLELVASAEIAEDVTSYANGDRPPDPRALRVFPTIDEGFRVDRDDFTDDEIGRDPFYQEFLRPRGLGWHACALLAGSENGDGIHLSFKRKLKRGRFEPSDLAMLAAQLPLLRAAVAFSRRLAGGSVAQDRLLETDARGLYGIDRNRGVSVLHGAAETERVVTVRRGRFVAVQRANQIKIEAALAGAYRRNGQSALLQDDSGRRWAFRVDVSPPGGQAGPFDALAVLTCIDAVSMPAPAMTHALSDLFGLSAAESRIAIWIAQGLSIDAVAARLLIRSGTVRNHLKAVFRKTGVSRQAELSAVLLRL